MGNHLSEEFIQSQKSKLISEKATIVKHLHSLKESDPFSDPEHSVANGAVDFEVSDQMQHHLVEATTESLEKRLKDIDVALAKIDKGVYGYCEKTNKPIPQARLTLVPEARFIIEK